MPSDKKLGIIVLGAIAVVAALTILGNRVAKDSIGENRQMSHTIRVIDGDTIELTSEKVRLFGIDAPEKGQPCRRNNAPYDCGAASKEHLEFLLTGAKVECVKKRKDKWGRYIALCYADGEDVSQMMVRHGWAIAYREYSAAYADDEEFAKSNRLGIWSKEFSIPSEWRKLIKVTNYE